MLVVVEPGAVVDVVVEEPPGCAEATGGTAIPAAEAAINPAASADRRRRRHDIPLDVGIRAGHLETPRADFPEPA